jgi:hypothetical protein
MFFYNDIDVKDIHKIFNEADGEDGYQLGGNLTASEPTTNSLSANNTGTTTTNAQDTTSNTQTQNSTNNSESTGEDDQSNNQTDTEESTDNNNEEYQMNDDMSSEDGTDDSSGGDDSMGGMDDSGADDSSGDEEESDDELSKKYVLLNEYQELHNIVIKLNKNVEKYFETIPTEDERYDTSVYIVTQLSELDKKILFTIVNKFDKLPYQNLLKLFFYFQEQVDNVSRLIESLIRHKQMA